MHFFNFTYLIHTCFHSQLDVAYSSDPQLVHLGQTTVFRVGIFNSDSVYCETLNLEFKFGMGEMGGKFDVFANPNRFGLPHDSSRVRRSFWFFDIGFVQIK